jgi:phosphoribosylformimino-5-aminoimidazole carboxamide ribotide isomerase
MTSSGPVRGAVCELFPAIDLLDGSVVRLQQGDYDRSTHYGSDPFEIVDRFLSAGARWIHLVDLNAARGDGPANRALIASIVARTEGAVWIQTGGGVRSVDDARALFESGVRRVVVGTAAVRNPRVVADIARLDSGQVAVGLDAHRGEGNWEVAVQGWTQSSGRGLLDVLDEALSNGAAAVVATDIARDGMLSGPSVELYELLLEHRRVSRLSFDVVASGGVSGIDDVAALAAMDGLDGVIAGRAIYEGLLDVEAAVRVCRGHR